MPILIQDCRRLVAVERGAVAPADAGEGGGGGGAVRREGRQESTGGDSLLRPRQQDPRQGRTGGCLVIDLYVYVLLLLLIRRSCENAFF